jgi:uncharacterized small protein (DUF1192 family)
MSNTTGRNQSGQSNDLQTSMFETAEHNKPSPAAQALSSAPVTMKGTRSLARLRDRVNLAVKELERLRSENLRLRKELDRAAADSHQPADGTSIVFAESADELRERIELCIGAIDAHMETQNNSTTAAEDA